MIFYPVQPELGLVRIWIVSFRLPGVGFLTKSQPYLYLLNISSVFIHLEMFEGITQSEAIPSMC